MNRLDLPWLKEYGLLGIPETFAPYPDDPVYEILYQAAKKYKKNGIIQYGFKMTYPVLKESVDRFAAALYGLGLKKGDRVATILPTSIQYVIADYAISRVGLVHIPSSSLEPFPVLEHKFKEGGPRALICLASYSDLALRLQKKTGIDFLILPKLEDYSSNDIKFTDVEDVSAVPGALWMSEMIEKSEKKLPQNEFNVESDIETLLFTGGTTGLPKGCMLTHRNIYANAIQSLHSFGQATILMKGAISVLLALPFFHSYGHVIMHTMTLMGVDQLLVPEPRDTENMVRMIKNFCPVMQIGVPAQFMKLAKEDLDGTNMIGVSGSAPLSPKVQNDFERKTGGSIMEGYGLSEMSPNTHINVSMLTRLFGGEKGLKMVRGFLSVPGVTPLLNSVMRLQGTRRTGAITLKLFSVLNNISRKKSSRSMREKKGTIGIPFPDTEVKIVDVDSAVPLTWDEICSGKTGELYLRGPQRMLGYWPEPESGLDEEGFVRTSDVVRVDERGYFSIVDRTKDMINVSGFKVYSREIDDILSANPVLKSAAIVGIPDIEREGSERVVAFVVPDENKASDVTEKSIIDYLQERVAKYAVPKFVMIIDELPLTPVQKIDKKALKKIAIDTFVKKRRD